MATAFAAAASTCTPRATWAGRALSGLAILALAADAGGKLIAPEVHQEGGRLI